MGTKPMTGYRIRTWTVLSGLLALSLIAGGCSTNPVTGKSEMILISENQELAMGREAAPAFEKEFGGKVPNAALQAYVSEVGMKVAAVSDRKNMEYEYTLVSHKTPNAFALPGGKIFITAGLMSRMTSERELAAVLGHETGHVAAKHGVKGMQRQMGTSVLIEVAAQIAGVGDSGKAVAKVVSNMATLKYSRNDEYQSDEVGIKYMAQAGYNPYGMVELLTVLLNLSESEPGSLGEMFQTHPLSSKRIANAEAVIQREHPGARPDAPDPGLRRFQNMRALLVKTVGKGK